MRVKVVSVADRAFDGKEGRVPGASLTFEENGQKHEVTGFGPQLASVLQWKEGEEHEIELFVNKDNKERFRLPQAQGGGKRGYEAAFRNTKEGQEFEQERMDRRTAIMQAVAAAQIPGYAVKDKIDLLAGAAEIYRWLRETASTR